MERSIWLFEGQREGEEGDGDEVKQPLLIRDPTAVEIFSIRLGLFVEILYLLHLIPLFMVAYHADQNESCEGFMFPTICLMIIHHLASTLLCAIRFGSWKLKVITTFIKYIKGISLCFSMGMLISSIFLIYSMEDATECFLKPVFWLVVLFPSVLLTCFLILFIIMLRWYASEVDQLYD